MVNKNEANMYNSWNYHVSAVTVFIRSQIKMGDFGFGHFDHWKLFIQFISDIHCRRLGPGMKVWFEFPFTKEQTAFIIFTIWKLHNLIKVPWVFIKTFHLNNSKQIHRFNAIHRFLQRLKLDTAICLRFRLALELCTWLSIQKVKTSLPYNSNSHYKQVEQ